MIIALQSAIASQNTAQASNIDLITSPSYSHSINNHTTEVNTAIHAALSRLNRIKWENIAFIGFQVWFVGMAFDAVSRVFSTISYNGLSPLFFEDPRCNHALFL